MARLIDADALPIAKEYCVDEAGFGASFYVVHKRDIDNAPTIEAKPVVHGYWISGNYGKLSGTDAPLEYCCSVCSFEAIDADNFCGGCGAMMDGDVK